MTCTIAISGYLPLHIKEVFEHSVQQRDIHAVHRLSGKLSKFVTNKGKCLPLSQWINITLL
jgi:hypothetical protein